MSRVTSRGAYALLLVLVIAVIGYVYQQATKKSTYLNDIGSVMDGLSGSSKHTSSTLILFSNNAEQRYGGGFIGSVGFIHTSGGKVVVDPIHSVYYYDHTLTQEDTRLESSPTELQGLTPKIWLRDSGYSMSWPENAARAAKLFEYESGNKVDNVVMLTPNVIKEALKVSGPIYLSDYKMTVSSDNFLDKVQLEVEAGGDKVAGKDPKTILGVLANSLLTKLYADSSVNSLAKYGSLFGLMARQKQIAVYSRNVDLEAKIRKLGLAGTLLPADGNYLSVSESNVGANKSSPFMKQSINQHLTILPDGTARVDLAIKRTHVGKYSHSYVDPHDGQTKWLVGANLSYVKLALPAGSIIERASFDQSRPIYIESGRSVVTFASNLEPGASSEYKVTYTLPFKYDLDGRVKVLTTIDKPQGGFDQDFKWSIAPPAGYRLTAGSGSGQGILKETIVRESVYTKNK